MSAKRSKCPAVSVDTKKKEVLGPKKSVGTSWEPKGAPIEVDVHNFPSKALGKAIQYGVYDIGANEAGVSVGISHDTAEFGVEALRRWWTRLGRQRYRKPKRILVTADSGGSKSSRSRLWKVELQSLADELGVEIEVCHYPPGTSKWNKIEHRLFCHITRNWRGVPLETAGIVVQLIGATRTEEGLEVHSWLEQSEYETCKKVTDKQLSECRIRRKKFHGDWNYSVIPR